MCFLVWALIVYVLYVCLFFVCFLFYFTTFVANKHIIFFHAKFQLHQYTALPIWGEELLKNYDFNQFASLWAPMPALSSITAKSGMSEWTQNVLYMLNFALINSVASAWCKTWNNCSTSKGVTTAIMTMTGMWADFSEKLVNLQIVLRFNAASSVIRRLDSNNLQHIVT